MRNQVIGLLFACLIAFSSRTIWAQDNSPPAAAPKQEVPATLDGEWQTAASPPVKWLINKESLSVVNGGGTEEFRYELNPQKQPAELTLFNAKRLLQGIYRLSPDSLHVALGSGTERPTSFEPKLGVAIHEFKRDNAKQVSEAATWEQRAAAALTADSDDQLKALASEFQSLPADVRRTLALRVRPDSVELTVRGDVPADGPGYMEFVIAGNQKSYEALLIVSDDELKRLLPFTPFFKKHQGSGRAQTWEARLVWQEDGVERSSDLSDILSGLDATTRNEFVAGQEIDIEGQLGGEVTTGKNVAADPASIPKQAGPAAIYLTLHRPARAEAQ